MIDFSIYINGKNNQVKIINDTSVELNGKTFEYELIETSQKKYLLKLDSKFYEVLYLNQSNKEHLILVDNNSINLTIRSALEEKAYQLISSMESSENNKTIIKSPMPGLVLKVLKSVEEKVFKGETILILEAMKMENEIKSPIDGTIAELFVEQGKPIEKNINLFSIK
jgi:biotin carboxyl carrier protein